MARFARMKRPIQGLALGCMVGCLCSCAATGVALEHHRLETSTRLSKTIFLDPVPDSQKTIFVVFKNTSDKTMNLEAPLKDAFRAHGYRLTKTASDAHYLLQANLLSAGKMSQAASKEALGGGFGSAVAGGVTGAAVGSFSNNANMMLAGGLIGGAAGLVADSLVKNVNYSLITDVQISEKTSKGYARRKTRVVSTAERVNLSYDTARPLLEKGLVNTLVGIF